MPLAPRSLMPGMRLRAWIAQFVLIAALVGAALWCLRNLQINLAERSIASGFAFLSQPAGFAIGESHIAYSPAASFARAILVGLLNTLKVAALAIVASTVLGFAIGLARLSRNGFVRGLARTYVEAVRNVPLLLQLLFLYALILNTLPSFDHAWRAGAGVIVSNRGFALPAVTGAGAILLAALAGLVVWRVARSKLLRARAPNIPPAQFRYVGIALSVATAALVWFVLREPLSISPPTIGRFNVSGGWQISAELVTLVLGLSIYTAAYIAEIVRAGMLSVPGGQREAAVALGLSRLHTVRHIILPQALRAIVPPMTSWHLNTVKNSSLAIAVGYPDLVSVLDTIINQTGQAIEGVAIMIGAYLVINLLIALALNLYNARLTRIGLATYGSGGARARQRPGDAIGFVRGLLGSWPNALFTIVVVALAGAALWKLLDWSLFSAVFAGDARECRTVSGAGACWPFLRENYREILFGTYPQSQQWRGVLVLCVFSLALAVSFARTLWNRRLVVIWIATLASMFVLLRGGVLGLAPVPTDKWSGLPLTLLLASVAVVLAVPLAVGLALGRRSALPLVRGTSVTFIELVRGVPLVGVLFLAAVMFPLFLPPALQIDSFARVQIALVLFTAAYMAEAVRGGLQAVPSGQYEAAMSLGLSASQTMARIVLPQALKVSLPGLVSTAISEVKNTTMVLIVGIFDVLQTTRLSLVDVTWRPFFVEAYLFTAVIFFGICFTLSQLSLRIERHLDHGRSQ